MKFYTGVVLFLFLSLLSFTKPQSTEKFRFANYYGDHMVLQRSPSAAIIWGYVPDCQSSVTVSMSSSSIRITATIERILENFQLFLELSLSAYCHWKVQLPATPAGGPHVITAQTKTSDGVLSISLKDVLFGDVWLCGGQSNMVFELSSAFNATEEIKGSSNYPNIRLMNVNREGSNITLEEPPLLENTPPWITPSPTTVGSFSAVCWFYGRYIYDAYSIPLGLISSNWGGTEIQLWSSPEALKKCPNSVTSASTKRVYALSAAPVKPSKPSSLWNSMIYPFLKMPIYGAIWYQGEANAHSIETAEQYKCLFPAMINDWREKWNFFSNQQTKQDFPFGFVQLAADGDNNKTQGFFPELRWSQTGGLGYVPNSKLENVFMAVAIDLGDPQSPHGSIHPRDKQDVGLRLATAGRVIAYGDKNIHHNGPLPYHVTSYPNDTGLTGQVFFENLDGPLYLVSKWGFELACLSSSDNKTEAWIEGTADRVAVEVVYINFPHCPEGYKELKRIRYAWRQNPCPFKQCAIYTGTKYRFPAPPFVHENE